MSSEFDSAAAKKKAAEMAQSIFTDKASEYTNGVASYGDGFTSFGDFLKSWGVNASLVDTVLKPIQELCKTCSSGVSSAFSFLGSKLGFTAPETTAPDTSSANAKPKLPTGNSDLPAPGATPTGVKRSTQPLPPH